MTAHYHFLATEKKYNYFLTRNFIYHTSITTHVRTYRKMSFYC